MGNQFYVYEVMDGGDWTAARTAKQALKIYEGVQRIQQAAMPQ